MPLHLTTAGNFTGKEAVGVNTGFMGITKDAPLASTGASYCIIIVFHVDGKGGALAHIPPGDDEAPAMAKMLDGLTKLGATANQVEVLLAGGAGREQDPQWRQNFLNKLTQLTLQVGNVIDARVATSSFQVTPIGNRPAQGMRSVVYDPKAAQVLPLGPEESHPTKGKSSSVKVYAIAKTTGAINATSQDGECIIL